jgi:hypothetical protein
MSDQAPATAKNVADANWHTWAAGLLTVVVQALVGAVVAYVASKPLPPITIQQPPPQVAPAPANPANSKLSADDVAKIVEALKAETKK